MRHEVAGSRARASRARLLLVAAGLAGCASSGPSTPAASESPPVEMAPAAFTSEQAARGERVFGTVCSVCHGRNEFRGPIFSLTWRVEPVGHLFQHISTTMPQDDPGSLADEEYAAIVAYMLQLNGRQPGDRELPTDRELLNTLQW